MAALAARTAVDLKHDHPSPTFRRPWWYWACFKCTPDLYQRVTRPEVGFTDRYTKCPWCIEKCGVSSGVLAFHLIHSEPCPASGVSRATAAAMLEGSVNNRPVEQALIWAQFTKAPDIDADLPAMALHPLIEELRCHVKASGRTGRDISASIGIPEPSFYKWWDVNRQVSPLFVSVIAVAHTLDLRMMVEHPQGLFDVASYKDLAAAAKSIRELIGISQNELGRRLGHGDGVITRHEKDEFRIGTVAAADWIEALGGQLRFRKKAVDVQG